MASKPKTTDPANSASSSSPSSSTSATNSTTATNPSTTAPTVSPAVLVQGFNQLRTEQRQLNVKLNELENEVNEHKLVLDALALVPSDRKCFRMVGGVLVERTVAEVKPQLENNKELITRLVESLRTQATAKGKQVVEYMEKHNLQIRAQ